MLAHEFELIEDHLTNRGAERSDVMLAVGDDAAVLIPAPGAAISAVATAFGDSDPATLARSCFDDARERLLSGGASPAWALLALTLERGDENWVKRFADALHHRCVEHGICLVGGDTTRGPRSATLFLLGHTAPKASEERPE